AVRRTVGDGLIDHIPRQQLALEMLDDGIDVIVKDAHGVVARVGAFGQPRRQVLMPYKRVTAHTHVVRLGEGNQLIRGAEIIAPGGRVSGSELHVVLGYQQVVFAS